MTTSCLMPTALTSQRIERANTFPVYRNGQPSQQSQGETCGTGEGSATK